MSHFDFSGPSGVSRPSAHSSQPGRSTGTDLARSGPRSFSANLRGVSDRELLSRVKDLVSRERAVTLDVLVHLIEVERRRLHLGLGYASMFDYCTRHLGYSSSAASRRIQSARCIRDYPEVYALLEKNEVNLVTISLVASILTESNATDLIERVRGKSQREVEAIVATYRPPVSMRDRARPVLVVATKHEESQRIAEAHSGQSCPITPTAGSEKTPNAAAGSAGGPRQATTDVQAQRQATTQPSDDHPASPAPGVERRFQVQFLASERFMKKFERVRALLSNKNGKPSYEAVLEVALDEFLKDHDPEERNKRRENRREKAEVRANSGNHAPIKKAGSRAKGGIGTAGCAPATDVGASRRLPPAVRDAVYARDKGRCTYVGSNGERCGATHHLQIDHVIPYARGGTSALGNLRLLCERHNKKEAERVFGENVMRSLRDRTRGGHAERPVVNGHWYEAGESGETS
jgi:hypothetical protein